LLLAQTQQWIVLGFYSRMARKSPTKQKRRIGRPPAGAREGEKVKDYPQLSIRLPGEVKAKLQALSLISSRPQWRLISDAIECYLRDRPAPEQQMVEELVGRSRGRAAASKRSR
jgi:predicted transcriptional regulator